MSWTRLRDLPMDKRTPSVSAFKDAIRQQVEPHLVCPKCGAANRPGVSSIAIDIVPWTAYCSVCATSGPVVDFQPKETDPCRT